MGNNPTKPEKVTNQLYLPKDVIDYIVKLCKWSDGQSSQNPGTIEKHVSLTLAQLYGGKQEIKCRQSGGKIDILTDSYIIEVKKVSDWKHALGQLKTYLDDFPNRKLAFCYFGKKPTNINYIVNKFNRENIVIICFEDEIKDVELRSLNSKPKVSPPSSDYYQCIIL